MAVGGAALPEGLNEDVASALVASVAANDAPLIGDRAATRGRIKQKVAMSAPV